MVATLNIYVNVVNSEIEQNEAVGVQVGATYNFSTSTTLQL